MTTTQQQSSSTLIHTVHLKRISQFPQLINKHSPNKHLRHEQLLHNILDTICGTAPGLQLSELIDEQQQQQEDDENAKLSLMDIESIIDAVKMFIQRVMSKELTQEEMIQELNALLSSKNMDENEKQVIVELFVRVIQGRRSDLMRTMQSQSVSELSQSYLHDFDWKLHLVIASDKCSSIREPVLLLNLRVKRHGVNQDILVELTKEDLDKILKDFSHIQKIMSNWTRN